MKIEDEYDCMICNKSKPESQILFTPKGEICTKCFNSKKDGIFYFQMNGD